VHALSDLLSAYVSDFDVSRETLNALDIYDQLLLKWQKPFNLVAPSTIADRHKRHFLDSLQLLPLIRQRHGTGQFVGVDIGSGAGFPGLVLACAGIGPMHMVEAVGKKARFMRNVSRETGVFVSVHQQRVEEMPRFSADIITSRACATISQLLAWGAPFVTDQTVFWLLKGAKADEELTEAQRQWTMTIDRFDSLTDPRGVILALSDVRRL